MRILKLRVFIVLVLSALLCGFANVVNAEWEQVQPQADGSYQLDLTPDQAVGLYKILRKNKKAGALTKKVSAGGSYVKCKLKVDGCPKVKDPYHEGWFAKGTIIGKYKLKNVRGKSGHAQKYVWAESFDLVWLPPGTEFPDGKLFIDVLFPGITITGPITICSTYNMIGISKEAVTTSSMDYHWDFGTSRLYTYPSDFETNYDYTFYMYKTKNERKSKLKIYIYGNPYEMHLGNLYRYDFGGMFGIAFEQSWLTQVDFDYDEVITENSPECSNQTKVEQNFDGLFGFIGDNGFEYIDAGGQTTLCRQNWESFQGSIKYESSGDGMGFRIGFMVEEPAGSGKSLAYNEIIAHCSTLWTLNIEASPDGQAQGAGEFEIGPSKTAAKTWSKLRRTEYIRPQH